MFQMCKVTDREAGPLPPSLSFSCAWLSDEHSRCILFGLWYMKDFSEKEVAASVLRAQSRKKGGKRIVYYFRRFT